MSRKDDAGPGDDELEALLAEALAQRGDLVPTTEAEVRAAEREGIEFEGDLPPGLLAMRDALEADDAPPADDRGAQPAPPVASIDDARRARARRSSWSTHGGAFALGLSAAAAALLLVRAPERPTALREPGSGVVATASPSAEPAEARIVIPDVRSCEAACCAGSSCPAAEKELRACASGRTCVPCGDVPEAGSAYRVRLGNVTPTRSLSDKDLATLDLCARVGGSAWSCEPAYLDAAARPGGRALPALASAADVASGIELELRPRGTKLVLGRWRDAVRLGPTALCLGVGALIASEKDVHMGSVALSLDDAHHVELGRAAEIAQLRALRARLDLGDVTPQLVETTSPGEARFALTVGPLDQATAERLRWALLERGQAARVTLGDDHAGASKPLP